MSKICLAMLLLLSLIGCRSTIETPESIQHEAVKESGPYTGAQAKPGTYRAYSDFSGCGSGSEFDFEISIFEDQNTAQIYDPCSDSVSIVERTLVRSLLPESEVATYDGRVYQRIKPGAERPDQVAVAECLSTNSSQFDQVIYLYRGVELSETYQLKIYQLSDLSEKNYFSLFASYLPDGRRYSNSEASLEIYSEADGSHWLGQLELNREEEIVSLLCQMNF